MKELEIVSDIIRKYISPAEASIFVFGSRVGKDFRQNSDLDILLDDHRPIASATLTKIHEELEESNLPFIVDLVLRSRIDEEFYEKIASDLRPVSDKAL